MIWMLMIGVAGLSVIVAESSGVMQNLKWRLFKRLRKWVFGTNRSLRMPLYLRPFVRGLRWTDMNPDSYDADLYIRIKPLDCPLCLAWWTSIVLATFYCQNLPEVILLIGGTPMLAVLISKIARQ